MELLHLTLKHPDKEEQTFTLEADTSAPCTHWDSDRKIDIKGEYYFLESNPDMSNIVDYLGLEGVEWDSYPGITVTVEGKYFIDVIRKEGDLEIFPTKFEVEYVEEEIDGDDENCWVEYPTVEE